MKPLVELCDLIAQNPSQFPDKIDWICNRCPPSDSFSSRSPTITPDHLNAILITARFISKCGNYNDTRPQTIIIDFIRTIPASFDQSLWPNTFGTASIASFYAELFGYVCKACVFYPEFESEVARVMGEVVYAAVNDRFGDLGISRAFLSAVSENFPPVGTTDANKLVTSLLDGIEFALPCGSSPKGMMGSNSSSQSSPVSVSNVAGSSSSSGGVDEVNSRAIVVNGGGNAWGVMGTPNGSDRRGVGVAYFEDESVENLEKQEIAFKLISHIVDKSKIDPNLLERAHVITKDQLKSVSSFLKVLTIGKFPMAAQVFASNGWGGHSCYRHLIWDDRYIEDRIVSRLGWTQRHNETGVINGCQTLVL
ncbi:putative 1-phosphatidylinositol 4-kinase [Helianthus anomalus]